MQTFFRFSPSPGRPPSEQPVSSSEIASQDNATSCLEQSFHEASASNTALKAYEKPKVRVKADHALYMKSWFPKCSVKHAQRNEERNKDRCQRSRLPETAVETLETLEPGGFDGKAVKCSTDEEARILAGKRGEKSHRNMALRLKQGRKGKKAKEKFSW